MPEIQWAEFTWQAFATLGAGAMAVGGALFIALRQMAITHRQADIAERQAGIQDRQAMIQDRQLQLQQINLKIQLYEKRLAIYEAAADFVLKLTTKRGMPDFETTKTFLYAAGKSRFLFLPKVHNGFSEMWVRAERIQKLEGKGEGRGLEATAELNDQLAWFDEKSKSLADLFADELRLSDVSAPLGSNP